MEYPNLELVAYRAQLMLQNDEEFKAKLAAVPSHAHFKPRPDFELIVFPQLWGSTALGFDGEIGGQAMTRAYTTVVHESLTGTYMVFFGDRPAYKVQDATDQFFTDLSERNLKSTSQAAMCY